MTATTPGPRVSLDVNVDQDEGDALTLTSRVLGTKPYVVVQLDVDEDGSLVVEADVAGPEANIGRIGWVLKMLGSALEKQGAELTEQAKVSGEDAVATMKSSEL